MSFRIACLAILIALPATAGEPKLRVVIIDGQSNHKWQETTPVLKTILEASGRFAVEVATTAPKGDKAGMAKFGPDLSKFDIVLTNYNGESWPKAFNDSLDTRLREGRIALVVVHAGNNCFGNWKEYYQMIGMGWQNEKFGNRLYFDDAGKPQMEKAGEGLGSGHRYIGPYTVTVRDAEHPVTKGMPKEWLHVKDELYDHMRGPIENVHVLATAYSDKAKKGTGTHEPMIWTVSYGKGRVFHTPLGHDAAAMRCVGFASTVERGSEWAATGAVTIPLRKDFPTAEKTSQFPAK